jgi:hypothetical protein
MQVFVGTVGMTSGRSIVTVERHFTLGAGINVVGTSCLVDDLHVIESVGVVLANRVHLGQVVTVVFNNRGLIELKSVTAG